MSDGTYRAWISEYDARHRFNPEMQNRIKSCVIIVTVRYSIGSSSSWRRIFIRPSATRPASATHGGAWSDSGTRCAPDGFLGIDPPGAVARIPSRPEWWVPARTIHDESANWGYGGRRRRYLHDPRHH